MTLASPSTALRGAAATAAHATLTPHLMLDPPLPRRGRDDAAQGGLFDVDVGTVWKTARAAEGGDTLLTVRCFSVEGLQLRLAQLVNGHAGVLSPSLAMFLRGGLDQAYVDALAYRRLVDAAPRVLGDLGAHPLHVDTLSRRLVVDTSRVRIDGEGTIDLANEKYALVLKSKSKQFSIFALRGPIVIGGSLRDPTVAPSVAPIAARVGVAAGLAAVSPALAILPFIDLGNTPDVDCRRVLGAPDNASVPVKEDSAAAGETDASSRAAPARGS